MLWYSANGVHAPTRSTTILTISVLMSWSAAVNAQSVEGAANPEPETRSRKPSWTSEKFLEAEPLPLPRASKDKSTPPPENQTRHAAPPGKESQKSDGHMPSEATKAGADSSTRLFPAAELAKLQSRSSRNAVVIPQDTGALKVPFSSSQVLPDGARLSYPYNVVGKIFFENPADGKPYICSGSVINRRLILTAGHCVHEGSGGVKGYHTNIIFVPAYNKGSAPYGVWTYSWVITTRSWATGGGSVPNAADLAIIEVRDNNDKAGRPYAIGDAVGWLGYRTNGLVDNHTKKIGYPAGFDGGEVMHQVDSQSFYMDSDNTVLYGSDMTGGSSGGPWIENFGYQSEGQSGGLQPWPNRVVGVTSYGPSDPGPSYQGSSVLGDEFIAIMKAACQHRAGNCSQ